MTHEWGTPEEFGGVCTFCGKPRYECDGTGGNTFFEVSEDPVNHPTHYTSGGIECIDALEAALTPEEFAGFCKGNVIKYAWRSGLKGGEEDLKKAEWYLKRLLSRGKQA